MEKPMRKSAKGLTAMALAVLGSQALASVPETSQQVGATKVSPITIGTGLKASDLFVGLDGTVPFDVNAHGLKVACASGVQENNGCTNVCCN
jgi:hypothetical protein